MKINKVLCPTDFSEAAQAAVRKAVDIARSDGVPLVLVHVLEEGGRPMRQMMRHHSFPNLEDEIKKGATRAMAETVKDLVGEGVEVSTEILSGVPSVEIAEAARTHGADLIVLASSGYGMVKRFLLGSTAERLMRIAPCSVLMVRRDSED